VLSSVDDAAVHLPPARHLPPVGTDGQFWISSSVVVGQAVAPVADVVAPPAALHKSAQSKKVCSVLMFWGLHTKCMRPVNLALTCRRDGNMP